MNYEQNDHLLTPNILAKCAEFGVDRLFLDPRIVHWGATWLNAFYKIALLSTPGKVTSKQIEQRAADECITANAAVSRRQIASFKCSFP